MAYEGWEVAVCCAVLKFVAEEEFCPCNPEGPFPPPEIVSIRFYTTQAWAVVWIAKLQHATETWRQDVVDLVDIFCGDVLGRTILAVHDVSVGDATSEKQYPWYPHRKKNIIQEEVISPHSLSWRLHRSVWSGLVNNQGWSLEGILPGVFNWASHLQWSLQVQIPCFMKNEPPSFQCLMNSHTRCFRNTVSCTDNAVTYSETWEELISQIKELFEALKQAGLVINLAKCEFGKGRVLYLGHQGGCGVVLLRMTKV